MSNPSLQEQLQPLVTASPSEKASHQKILAAKKPEHKKAKHQKPIWLEYVFYGIELLKAYYPNCFKETAEVKPLKIGIKQDLVKNLSTHDDIIIADKTCMIKSLTYYVTTMNYFKNVREGVSRIDLEGNEAGTVTSEEARYSAEQYQTKLQKKSTRARLGSINK